MTASASLDFATLARLADGEPAWAEENALESATTLDRFLASVERRAFRIAQMAVRDRDDALDIVQGAMLRLARNYARRPSEEWKPLFYRILYNGIRDFQRRRSVRSRIFGLLPGQWADDEEAPADPFEQVAGDVPEPSRQLMADEARSRGVGIETGVEVAEVLVDGGRAVGVRLSSGDEVFVRAVAANVNPKLLYQRMVANDALPADFAAAIDRYRCGSGAFRINVALAELPDFHCLPGTQAQPHHASGIVFAPSLAYMDRAWRDAEEKGFAASPIVTVLDASSGLVLKLLRLGSLALSNCLPQGQQGFTAVLSQAFWLAFRVHQDFTQAA